MRLIVSDSSTLIHLARIGRLALLKEFFGQVVITLAVYKEVVEQGGGRAGAAEVTRACQSGWIEIMAPADESLVRLLKRDLDDGEAEVIALAIEQRAMLLLVDESEARRIAGMYGLPKTGVIGILLRAKREGHIDSLRVELDRLRGPGGFWIEDRLYHQALRTVGEESL